MIRSIALRMLVALSLALPAIASGQDFEVTLLGTGSPFPLYERFGMSTLVEAGSEKLLFDVGRGSTIRLWQPTDILTHP